MDSQTQAQWVDLLGELEALKNTITATQARLAVALDVATKADEARQGIRAVRRGKGVPNQVGAAMQSSPHAGASFLGAARVWVTQMPHTFDALRTGVLSSWRAVLLVKETSHLSVEHRAVIDEEICGPVGLSRLMGWGTRRLVARVKELAAGLDVHACVKRNARAVSERGVSVRPAPDLMVYLTALVPMAQGVQAYAQLKAHADAARAGGDGRGAGQIMADTLIERVTGRGPGGADEVPVTINLLVSDQTLLTNGDEPGDQSGSRTPDDQPGSQPGDQSAGRPGDPPGGGSFGGAPLGGAPLGGDQLGGDQLGGDLPGVVLEGMAAGAGVVPAPVVRHLVANGLDADAAWLRAVYVDPRGRLLGTSSTSRFHPKGLSVVLRAREQGICATAWCDAPVRHLDHVTPHAEGGETSLSNGQGLCVRCNHAKQAPGWRQKTTQVDGRHAVETVTPTGHTYVSVAPRPPEPVRADVTETATPAGLTPVTAASTGYTPAPVAPVVPATEDPAKPRPARDPRDRTRQPAPEWTPAVGVAPPAPGRIPRSRYSIGCHTPSRSGAIAYRPPGNPPTNPSNRRRRTRHHRRTHPDLSWTHTR